MNEEEREGKKKERRKNFGKRSLKNIGEVGGRSRGIGLAEWRIKLGGRGKGDGRESKEWFDFNRMKAYIGWVNHIISRKVSDYKVWFCWQLELGWWLLIVFFFVWFFFLFGCCLFLFLFVFVCFVFFF
jgi:hypothetical protein